MAQQCLKRFAFVPSAQVGIIKKLKQDKELLHSNLHARKAWQLRMKKQGSLLRDLQGRSCLAQRCVDKDHK